MLARTLLTCLLLLIGAEAYAQTVSPAERGLMRETRETMRSLAQDLRAYSGTHEEAFPETLKALIDTRLREEIPKDAWGNDFVYALDEENGYKLVSRGADGKEGGAGAAADIVWTRDGEQLQLTGEQQAELDRKREDVRHEARVALTRARMVIAGREASQFRKNKGSWPEVLTESMRPGESAEDKAVNACFHDAWGNPLELRILPADNVAIVCWGANGAQGGSGHNGDFVVTERDVRAHVRGAQSNEGWGRTGFDWQIENLSEDVAKFRAKHERLPDELNELTRGGAGEAIRGSIPTDLWGNEYIYFKLDDDNFAIVGLGRDQRAGGKAEDADVIYPQPGGSPESGMGRGIRVVPEEEAEAPQDELLVEVAVVQMIDMVEKLKQHEDEHGDWPESLEDIAELLPGEEVPKDPWDNEFQYERVTDEEGAVTGFKLTCRGSDGAEGGEGHAGDIVFTQDGRYQPEPAGDEGVAEPE